MHMADALVSPAVAGTMYACSGVAAGISVHKLKLEGELEKIPVMGVMGAFVFATQMINFTIPGTGSSGHLCGGMLLTALLGPYAGFLTMIGVLLIQCLVFADGGILALGCNVWNMAFYGCFIGALIWKFAIRRNPNKTTITLASIIGSVLTLQLGAFSVTLETLFSGITDLPFTTFLVTMQPIHLAIGFVEGLITAAVLCFVVSARPSLLWKGNEADKQASWSLRKTVLTLAAAAAVIAGGLSLFASQFPDGLEWSIAKLTGSTELESQGAIYNLADAFQQKTALLPDYGFKNSDLTVGTSFSGIVGGILVIGLLFLVCWFIKLGRNRRSHDTP